MADATLHIAVLPYLAFGHLLPSLELAKSLAERGHRISILSTSRNLQRLPKIPPDLCPLIDLVPLPLPHVDGLPAGAEATSDLPPDRRQFLQKAFDGLEGPFAQFVAQAAPDWVVHDFAAYWAHRAGVPCAFFSTFPASTMVFFGRPSEIGGGGPREDLTVPPRWVPFPTTVACRFFEVVRLAAESVKSSASGVSEGHRLKEALLNCKVVAQRSSPEFEPDWFRVLQGLHEKPVIPVGLLPAQERGGVESESNKKLFDWLETRAPGSVVYVALGSEATLSNELLHELALGLELSQLPFLWALRKPAAEMLPTGFEGRTRGCGRVAVGWVPQVEVLAHAAVGGFLTHCGWSSIVEGLQFGRPLVLLPVFGDQGLNARAMGEKKVGLEVERGEEDGAFTREGVARAVRVVMMEQEGEAIRANARVMREIFGDKERQQRHVDGFARFLLDYRLPQHQL